MMRRFVWLILLLPVHAFSQDEATRRSPGNVQAQSNTASRMLASRMNSLTLFIHPQMPPAPKPPDPFVVGLNLHPPELSTSPLGARPVQPRRIIAAARLRDCAIPLLDATPSGEIDTGISRVNPRVPQAARGEILNPLVCGDPQTR
jgi:hypothetical protein